MSYSVLESFSGSSPHVHHNGFKKDFRKSKKSICKDQQRQKDPKSCRKGETGLESFNILRKKSSTEGLNSVNRRKNFQTQSYQTVCERIHKSFSCFAECSRLQAHVHVFEDNSNFIKTKKGPLVKKSKEKKPSPSVKN